MDYLFNKSLLSRSQAEILVLCIFWQVTWPLWLLKFSLCKLRFVIDLWFLIFYENQIQLKYWILFSEVSINSRNSWFPWSLFRLRLSILEFWVFFQFQIHLHVRHWIWYLGCIIQNLYFYKMKMNSYQHAVQCNSIRKM